MTLTQASPIRTPAPERWTFAYLAELATQELRQRLAAFGPRACAADFTRQHLGRLLDEVVYQVLDAERLDRWAELVTAEPWMLAEPCENLACTPVQALQDIMDQQLHAQLLDVYRRWVAEQARRQEDLDPDGP